MSHSSSERGGRATRDAWIEKVLGISVAQGAAGSSSGSIRGALIGAARQVALPADDADLPAALAGLAPNFLAAIIDSPERSTKVLEIGDAPPLQDQMSEVAGLLDLLGRKLDAWAAALDDAEMAKSVIVASAKGNPATYRSEVLADYEASRQLGLKIEAEIATASAAIRVACEPIRRGLEEGA